MAVHAEYTDVHTLASGLASTPGRLRREVRQVVSRGALQIRRGAQQRVRGYPHLPHYPRSISYDLRVIGDYFEARIGPDKGRAQGPLGTIIENGSVNNAPIPHLSPSLDEEEPRYVRALGAAGARTLDEI